MIKHSLQEKNLNVCRECFVEYVPLQSLTGDLGLRVTELCNAFKVFQKLDLLDLRGQMLHGVFLKNQCDKIFFG